jgi:hypothetical protein
MAGSSSRCFCDTLGRMAFFDFVFIFLVFLVVWNKCSRGGSGAYLLACMNLFCKGNEEVM